jgi:hypothetical protein
MSESARVAVVELCVDDRLDHAKVREAVRSKLRSIYLEADRIILVNEVGGNFGENFRNTIDVFRELGARIVFCAILHHDDCAADLAGRRLPLERSVADLSAYLSREGLTCPVYTGTIQTATGAVSW